MADVGELIVVATEWLDGTGDCEGMNRVCRQFIADQAELARLRDENANLQRENIRINGIIDQQAERFEQLEPDAARWGFVREFASLDETRRRWLFDVPWCDEMSGIDADVDAALNDLVTPSAAAATAPSPQPVAPSA